MERFINNTSTFATDCGFIIIVHGSIPELLPNAAFRRSGKSELAGRKVIKCPYCAEALTDVDRKTKVELFRMPSRKGITCHTYKKCRVCKGEVGILIAQA